MSQSLTEASEWDKSLALLGAMARLVCNPPHTCPPRHWTADGAAHDCAQCTVSFTLMNRKHHCRCCGAVVCGACSAGRVGLGHWGVASTDAQRVCNSCETFETTMLADLLAGEVFTLPVAKDVLAPRYVSLSPDLSSLTVDALPAPAGDGRALATAAPVTAPAAALYGGLERWRPAARSPPADDGDDGLEGTPSKPGAHPPTDIESSSSSSSVRRAPLDLHWPRGPHMYTCRGCVA